jgi:hypothetical protein
MNTAQVEWARTRIRSAAIVNGKYKLDVQRETNMGNLLFIPGLTSPVAEIRQLLFGAGQPGGSWIPTLSAAMIAANTFGSGVTDILDLSGNNNPFSQATPSSRGAWFREPKTGRRNLVLQTETLNSSPWTGAAVPVLQPDGGWALTGFGDALGSRFQQPITILPSTTYCGSVQIRGEGSDIGKNVEFVLIRTSTTSVVNSVVSVTLTGQYQTILNTVTTLGDTIGLNFRFTNPSSSGNAIAPIVRFPQFELGTTRTAYQRVTTAFDVTEQGQRDCYGVRADGIDDLYLTSAVNLTTTNQITVFAATKNITSTSGCVLGRNTTTTADNFEMFAPSAGNTYAFRARGFADSIATSTLTFTPPSTGVLTGQGGFGSDTTLRRNGTIIATAAGSNPAAFRNEPLRLFCRVGPELFFNGDLYALIVAGGSYPLSTIQRVERLLSRITPTVNL